MGVCTGVLQIQVYMNELQIWVFSFFATQFTCTHICIGIVR